MKGEEEVEKVVTIKNVKWQEMLPSFFCINSYESHSAVSSKFVILFSFREVEFSASIQSFSWVLSLLQQLNNGRITDVLL